MPDGGGGGNRKERTYVVEGKRPVALEGGGVVNGERRGEESAEHIGNEGGTEKVGDFQRKKTAFSLLKGAPL